MIPAIRMRPPPLTLGAGMRLEELLTHVDGFALSTITPGQRAFCRVADGLPLGDLQGHPDVTTLLGTTIPLPCYRPKEICLFSGPRTGKSMEAAALGIRSTQVVDVSGLSAGDIPRVSIISIDMDKAHAVLEHIAGVVREKPAIRALCLDEPKAESIMFRHPSGRPIEIKVVGGKRAGGAVVSRWSAGIILDESPRMDGEGEAVVNMDDVVREARARLLPGAQLFPLGSPWAPHGPVYKLVMSRWGNPSPSCVIFWGASFLLNPMWWTPALCAELKADPDPAVYAVNVLAQFHESVTESALPSGLIDACTREERPPERGMNYSAAIDPATRRNAWSLVIGHQDRQGRQIIDLVREWQGSHDAPLSPRATLAEVAAACKPYGVDAVYADQWSVDANREIAAEFDLGIREVNMGSADKFLVVKSILGWLADSQIEFPRGVLPEDLKKVKRLITRGGISIDLPKSTDGRHCDSAAATLVLLHKGLQDPEAEQTVKPREGTPEYIQAQADDMRARAFGRVSERKERRWYEQ